MAAAPPPTKCFSFIATRNRCFQYSFTFAGLKSTTADLGDGTVIHVWAPKSYKPNKPTLLLIHGIGANAMWQWNDFISTLIPKFNLYVPDLIFFGESYSTRPERSEEFQAESLMRAMEKLLPPPVRLSLVGLSYGGFVAYSMAAQFPEKVEKVVIGCSGICFEEADVDKGMFSVSTVEEATSILLAQTPEKMRELLKLSHHKPPKNVPTCFLSDFIDVMNREFLQERKELIEALHKDRKLSNIPKITQPTLIIWGEHDRIFPLELGHRLKKHIGENAELVILKDAGHAINIEKPKEMYKCLKSFLVDPPKHGSNDIGHKVG